MRDHVSVSSVSTYLTCPRQYYYAYSGTVRDAENTHALDVGSLLHDAIEILWREDLSKAKHHILYGGIQDDSTRATAYDVFNAYAHHIRHDLGFVRPVMLEEPFAFTLPETDITVTGRIDAVMQNADGKMYLVDWKVRQFPYTPEMVQLDMQLYVYYYYIREVLGLPVTGAQQVQLLKGRLPKPVYVDSDSRVTMSGYTTNYHFETALQRRDLDPDTYRRQFAARIKPVDHFILQTPIDTTHTAKMLARFADNARRCLEDTTFTPVNVGYTCKMCNYQNSCLTSPN